MQAVIGDLEISIRYVQFVSKDVGSFKRTEGQVPDRSAAGLYNSGDPCLWG